MSDEIEADDLYFEEKEQARVEGALQHIHCTLERVLEEIATLKGLSDVDVADQYNDGLIAAEDQAVEAKLNESLVERQERRRDRLEQEASILETSRLLENIKPFKPIKRLNSRVQ